MAGRKVLVREAIVLKIAPTGETYLQIRLLSPDFGLLSLLQRRSSKKQVPTLDLFDQGEAAADLKPDEQNGFLNDFTLERRRSGIGRSYSILQAAARLSSFLAANPVHQENMASTFTLAEKALDALDAGLPTEPILFKTFFVYCRDEGYPVVEEWARQLPSSLAIEVRRILKSPLAELDANPESQSRALASLSRYIEQSTQIRLD